MPRTLLAIVLLACAAFAAQKEFAPPKAFHANTYPARDDHPHEKVSIAADPYDMPDKAAIFRVPFQENDMLPVHLIISNDGDAPILVRAIKVQFITVDGVKLNPADEQDFVRRFGRAKRRPGDRRPIPIPIPDSKPQMSVKPEYLEEFEAATFRARAVEPKSTQSGFFFFDVRDIKSPLNGARVYVTGIVYQDGKDLFFFEIPMEKYLTYQPPK